MHLVKGVDGGREASVHAEDLVVDHRRQTEVVEDLGAVAPHVHRAVLPQTLVVEAVDLRDLPRLVVAADEGNAVGITHLQHTLVNDSSVQLST